MARTMRQAAGLTRWSIFVLTREIKFRSSRSTLESVRPSLPIKGQALLVESFGNRLRIALHDSPSGKRIFPGTYCETIRTSYPDPRAAPPRSGIPPPAPSDPAQVIFLPGLNFYDFFYSGLTFNSPSPRTTLQSTRERPSHFFWLLFKISFAWFVRTGSTGSNRRPTTADAGLLVRLF